VRHDQDAAVAAATVADDARSALLADLLGRVAGCFPRRETRQSCGQMVRGLLMELAWVVGLILLARWLYRRGLRHYSAYGG